MIATSTLTSTATLKPVSSASQENLDVQEQPSSTTQTDPLIAKGLQREQYIGIIAFAIGLIVLVRLISRRVDYAIIFAIFLSIILITIFLTL